MPASSVSQASGAEQEYNGDYPLQLARGLINNQRLVIFSGYNPDIDTSWESLIPVGGTVTLPPAALQMKVSSTNAADTLAGTGARTILIMGLDNDFNELSETVILNGQTVVTTVNSFIRINGLTVLSAGPSGSNTGDIYLGSGVVTAGVPSTVYDVIPAGQNNRQTHAYTIPAGYTGYTIAARFVTAQVAGSDIVWARLTMTGPDGLKRAATVAQMNNGVLPLSINAPIPTPEKTTIAGEGMGRANDNFCSSIVQLILIKNE